MSSKREGAAVKTNAVRALERAGLAYRLLRYPVGDAHLSAGQVAELIAQPVARVFKTLVARGDRTGPLFAVLPGDCELDLKALARASANRRTELVALAEVTSITGYVRGGTTVLAARKALPAYLDESAHDLPELIVSAGQRGVQMALLPADYIRATGAQLAPLVQRVAQRG